MTLTTRLLVFFLSTLALVLVGFSATLYMLANSYLHRQVEERLDTVLNTLSAAIEAGPGHVEWEPASRHLNLDFSLIGEQVVWLVANDHGQVMDRSKGDGTDQFLVDASPSLQLKASTSDRLKWEGASWSAGQRWIHADKQDPKETKRSDVDEDDNGRKHPALSITVGVSLAPVRATLGKLASSLIGLSVGIWIVALVAGHFVCRRALLPISHMAAAAGEMDANDLAQRLPIVTTNDELQILNRSFNNLLDRLQVSFERQRSFTGDASHQLRTPLTAILGQVEVSLRRERTGEEYRQVLGMVQQKSTHLARMVESLLFLARADSESRLPALESIDLTHWLPQHLHTWSEHVRCRDIILECPSSVPCKIVAQPALLGELLNILLDNACKYSEPGTPIKIRLEQVANAVNVHVEDQGYGIEESHHANLFVPFFRSDETRRRRIEGVGLGLSIAKRLAEEFDGALTVESRPGQGSCFTLRFSLARSKDVGSI